MIGINRNKTTGHHIFLVIKTPGAERGRGGGQIIAPNTMGWLAGCWTNLTAPAAPMELIDPRYPAKISQLYLEGVGNDLCI